MRYVICINIICFLYFLKSSGMYSRTERPVYSAILNQNQHLYRTPTSELIYPEYLFPLYYPYNPGYFPTFSYSLQPSQNISGSIHESNSCHHPMILPLDNCILVNTPVTNQRNTAGVRMINETDYMIAQRYISTTDSIPGVLNPFPGHIYNRQAVVKKYQNNTITQEEELPVPIHHFKYPMYMILNKYHECFLATNQCEIFNILQFLYRKKYVCRLEYFYPIIDLQYKITLKNIYRYENEIQYMTNRLKKCVDVNISQGNYSNDFFYSLVQSFRNGASLIFYKQNNLPIIYLKPIFLLLPIWIDDLIQKEKSLAKNLFYISWCLNIIKALMEYNQKSLNLYNQDLERRQVVAFSHVFEMNKGKIYSSFNCISKFVKNIFLINNKTNVYEIFSNISGVGFIPSQCDKVFSAGYICSGMPGIIFDIFILLSEESLKLVSSLIEEFDVLKEAPENKNLKFAFFMKKKISHENYITNENIRSFLYDVASTYEKIFLNNFFFKDCVKNVSRLKFKTWITDNMRNLNCQISRNILPKYSDYIRFIETCNIFLHYISKVVLNPGLSPKNLQDIIYKKLISHSEKKYFQ